MIFECSCGWVGNSEELANRHRCSNIVPQEKETEMTGMEIVRTLTQDKETKGAVRYSDADGLSIYLRKSEVNFPEHPQQIKVTITASA